MTSDEAMWFRQVAAAHHPSSREALGLIAEAYDAMDGPRTLHNHIDEDIDPSVEVISIERTDPDQLDW